MCTLKKGEKGTNLICNQSYFGKFIINKTFENNDWQKVGTQTFSNCEEITILKA